MRARELGVELKELRVNRGLGVRQLAKLAGWSSHAGISLWERGERLPSPERLTEALAAMDVESDEVDRLQGLLREARSPGQIAAGVPGIGEILQKLIEYEQRAASITDVAPLLIPGLLQTTGYSRAILGTGPNTETRVALRAGRRDAVTRNSPPPVELRALIDSEVLTRPVAPAAVMNAQLRHLLDMAQRPNITIQLTASARPGWHPGLAGPFELIEFPKADPIVLLEHHRSSMFLWRREDVREFQEASVEIQKAAMTPAESAEVIAFIVNGAETT